MRMLYIVGEPGVGKSSVMRALTSTLRSAPVDVGGVPLRAVSVNGQSWHAAELGVRRPAFSGTDAMSMSVQPKVVRLLDASPFPLLVAEGDRLANGKFFDAVQAAGWELAVVHLWAPPETLAARRAGRGDRQDAKWVQGRATKVARLVAAYSALPIQATAPAMVIAEHLAALPGPVGRMVRELRSGQNPTRGAEMLVVPEQGGAGASAGLPDDVNGGAADGDSGTPEPDEEATADTAGPAPNDESGA